MPATDTGESRLIRSVPVVNRSAHAAPFGGVARIDFDHGDANAAGLVFYKLPKLGERPGMQASALRAAGLNATANVGQVFDPNRAARAFSLGNEHFRNNVVGVVAKAGLLAREFLQPALGCFGAALLKPGLAAGKFAADVLDSGPGVAVAVAIEGDVDHAEIDANHVRYACLFRVWDVAGASQIPLAADKHQIDFALAVGEQRPLSSATDKVDLLASGQCPDAYTVVGQEPDDAVIIGLGGVPAETALAVFPSLVGIGRLGDAADGRLRGQAEHYPDLGIGQFVQVELPDLASLEASSREVIAGLIATLKRLPKQGLLLWRRLKLDVGNQLHILHIGEVRGKFKTQPAERQSFLPALKDGVSALKRG